MIAMQLPGVALRSLPTAPRQLPFYAGATYFELDRNSPQYGFITSTPKREWAHFDLIGAVRPPHGHQQFPVRNRLSRL